MTPKEAAEELYRLAQAAVMGAIIWTRLGTFTKRGGPCSGRLRPRASLGSLLPACGALAH